MKNIVIFSSGGPGNAKTAIDYCNGVSFMDSVTTHSPLIAPIAKKPRARVMALITDREDIPAIDYAQHYNIPYYVFPIPEGLDFKNPQSIKQRTIHSDSILFQLRQLESESPTPDNHEKGNSIDCIVLAFQKILTGKIINHYAKKMINVHPADLTVYHLNTRQRRYIGLGGLKKSLQDSVKETRTSVHYVDQQVDHGDLIALGPFVPFHGDYTNASDLHSHELQQKIDSDPYALWEALHTVLQGD